MLADCKTAEEVLANYRSVRQRVREWKAYLEPPPAVVVEPIAVSSEPPPAPEPPKRDHLADLLEILSRAPKNRPYETYVPVRRIVELVALTYGLKVSHMLSHRRTANLVRPRHIAMYLAKQITPESLPQIGRRMGGKDHTTILHGIRKITAQRLSDPTLDAELTNLERQLMGAT